MSHVRYLEVPGGRYTMDVSTKEGFERRIRRGKRRVISRLGAAIERSDSVYHFLTMKHLKNLFPQHTMVVRSRSSKDVHDYGGRPVSFREGLDDLGRLRHPLYQPILHFEGKRRTNSRILSEGQFRRMSSTGSKGGQYIVVVNHLGFFECVDYKRLKSCADEVRLSYFPVFMPVVMKAEDIKKLETNSALAKALFCSMLRAWLKHLESGMFAYAAELVDQAQSENELRAYGRQLGDLRRREAQLLSV